MFAYLLLAYGKKPDQDTKILSHAAARSQFRNFRALIPAQVLKQVAFVADYARKIECLDDLPNLASRLRSFRNVGEGTIIVDDFARLFRACEPHHRVALMNELEEFGSHISSLRHSSKLSKISGETKRLIILHPELTRNRPIRGAKRIGTTPENRAEQTAMARGASLESRRTAAAVRRDAVLAMKADLEADGIPRSAAEVAEEANRRGLRTGHGRLWSKRAVQDMIRQSDA